jgi:hypothetical protein
MIAIAPKTSAAANPKTGKPFVAVGFTIDFRQVSGAMQGARPRFYDTSGAALPDGVVPLVVVAGQSPTQIAAAEATDIARACSEAPTLAVDQAAKGVIVATRGVVLA